MSRTKVLTVTIKDCDIQTFRCGGRGGQNKDKRDTGVRIIHPPSGARGESRDERDQLHNKRKAFRRMAESKKFKAWVTKMHSAAEVEVQQLVDEQMRLENLEIEYGPFDE